MSTLTPDEKYLAQVEAAVMGLQLEVGHLLELVRASEPDDSVLFKSHDVLDAVRNMLAVMFQVAPEDKFVLDTMVRAAKGGLSS